MRKGKLAHDLVKQEETEAHLQLIKLVADNQMWMGPNA